ncbi:hypothetical protein IVB08_06465 [Bradyrhizobium sp. 173]|uniref:hypothetical protein n=1 Tax=unclassified Bradyrhizobium TaxID=2631580 RepID=UPI001FFC24E5|nr:MULTISPECIES: hypothetical protein [unclassified Bradyrhizobium]MCK1322935.1 hypothetical protein [Bradyrhizobium sp. 156]MCK1563622.1 hypothetical protein [Bradyrhizobium sp. 173]
MATSGDLAKALSDLLKEPFSTVDLYGRHLRAAGLLSIKGQGRGAAEMTARDAAAWMVALAIDHERGGDFAREVRRVLALPLFEAIIVPDYFGDDLRCKTARTAGEALASLFHDTLVPRIREVLASGRDNVIAGFDGDGEFVMLSIQGPHFPEVHSAAMLSFQRGERKRRNIEKTVTVHGRVLLEIAKLLDLKSAGVE